MLVDLISKLVTTITFKKVLIWTLALVFSIMSYTAYEHRNDLFETTGLGQFDDQPAANPVGTLFSVGDATQRKVIDFVKQNKEVVGFIILSVDIRLNLRTVTFFHADPTAKNQEALAALATVDRIPLFTKNEENNRQMIKLINGEFTCAPYISTLISTIVPEVNKEVISICRASLPPYYGHYSGFVAVILNVDPDVDMQVRLKQSVEALATEIYFRDVIPTTRRVNLVR